MPWYVLYTNPRAEKKVAEQLGKIGISNYCPMVTKISQWSDRKKKIQVPLFSSYVFVDLEESERQRVFEVKGIMNYLYWLGKPAIVRDEEIGIIRQWLSETTSVRVEQLQPGDRMKLTDGPFIDQQGIIKEINSNSIRLVLEAIGVVLTIQQKP